MIARYFDFGDSRSDAEALFWTYATKGDGCWTWTGPKARLGYGLFSFSGWRKLPAHRVAFSFTNSPPPSDLCACHRCDNPSCVNPSHLFLGTKRDNTQDMIRKGRAKLGQYCSGSLVGELNPAAKLTEAQVRAIREEYATGGMSQPKLAKKYGVWLNVIWLIIHRRKWNHVV